MSHRSKTFMGVYKDAVNNLKSILNVPDDYSILFMQGGATAQFSAVPLNLLGLAPEGSTPKANYIISGVWSQKAAEEAQKYLAVDISSSNADTKHTMVPTPAPDSIDTLPVPANTTTNPNPASIASSSTPAPAPAVSSAKPCSASEYLYTYCCPNETVHGVELTEAWIAQEHARTGAPLLVADYSSSFCSRPIPVDHYDVIFAGAQKNIGPAGVTVVIVKKNLLSNYKSDCPIMLNWTIAEKNDSMYNTPPCFAIYACGLVFKWILMLGGLQVLEQVNLNKSIKLYQYIDNSALFNAPVAKECRSRMNVVFTAINDNVQKKLLDHCNGKIVGIAGHRSVGGFRVSLYNAVSDADVDDIVRILEDFEKNY